MRKLSFTCLTIVALTGSTSFAVTTQPVQPASVQPTEARQTTYVYDDGEDDDANASANEIKEMEQTSKPEPEAAAAPVDNADDTSDVVAGSSERFVQLQLLRFLQQLRLRSR